MKNGELKAILEQMVDASKEINQLREQNLALGERLRMIDLQIRELREISKAMDQTTGRVKKADWLTAVELGQVLKVTPKTIRTMHTTGRIRGYRLDPENQDSHLRFILSEVQEDLCKIPS